jgi:hypothetical protein
MKKNKKLSAFIIIGAFLFAISIIFAFRYRSINKKPATDWTNYYWFNASGTYLRQNLVDDEILLTGFDEFQYAPYTIRERGYAPANVSGNPPTPNEPYNPAKRLYSHP